MSVGSRLAAGLSHLCPPFSSSSSFATRIVLTPSPLGSRSLPSFSRRHFRISASMASSKESAANNPGLVESVDPATKDYLMQQTMYRIKDPQASLKFYSEVLGMRLLKRLDFPAGSFTVYFLGYEDPASIPTDPGENLKWFCQTKGTLELTHNWGTETDPDFKGYHNGNSEPRGWGHIGLMVDDVYKACKRFERLGVEFVKKPDEGKMKGLAFIKDPDGYWIEILAYPQMAAVFEAAS